MSNDPFFQMVSVSINFGRVYKPGEINRIFKSIGATLHYDVYAFERNDQVPIWQSESYIYTTLMNQDAEVDAQESADCVVLNYPLATIGAEYIVKFAEVVEKLSEEFESHPVLGSRSVDKSSLISHCEKLVTRLMQEWGEEPGSETLRMLIENNTG